MSNENKVLELKTHMEKQDVAARKTMEAQKRSAKLPVMAAYQQRQITAEEYQEIVGETYEESVKESYTAELIRIKETMRNRVVNGWLTAEEYKSITGEKYTAEE